jgi:hypothetical protein
MVFLSATSVQRSLEPVRRPRGCRACDVAHPKKVIALALLLVLAGTTIAIVASANRIPGSF